MAVTQEEARQEWARRELARRNFLDYVRYMLPSRMVKQIVQHHEMMAEKLQQVHRYIETGGEEGIGRLMVFMPPRYWKTLMVSRLFPSWVLGKLPNTQIILTSYASGLALKNSKDVRDFVSDPRFVSLFGEKSNRGNDPVMLSTDSRSVESWRLAAPYRGGVKQAAGVAGGVTGEGGHLIIIDDPFKNRKEAESEARREEIWDWWRNDIYTRREDGAAIVIPQTRWHVDGLSGRLLKLMAEDPGADQWDVLSLPAIWETPEVPEDKSFSVYQQEKLKEGVYFNQIDPLDRRPGDALWPEKHDQKELEGIRTMLGQYAFEALYQQQPYLRAGDYFKREYFPVVDRIPEDIVSRIRYWDLAGTSGGGAYTSGVLISKTADNYYYVEHVTRGQWSEYQRNQEIVDTANLDLEERGFTVYWLEQEPGSSGKDQAGEVISLLAEAGFEAHAESVTGKKTVRAAPWSSICEAGKVFLVRGGWNEVFIEEHIGFPKGKYKDQVDSAAGAFSKLRENVLEGALMA